MDKRHQIILLALSLTGFGLLMVYDASSAQALEAFGDKFYFLKDQAKWVFLGIAAFIFASFFDYRLLRKFAAVILVGCLVLLVAVFVPVLGVKAYGASRWLNFGFAVIQPSELAKLAVIIYLSAWLTNREKGQLLPFLMLVGLLVGLIIAQPDMGTAVVLLGTSLSIYFLSNNSILGLVGMLPVVVAGGYILTLLSPYRLKRLTSFLNPESDPYGASYHIRQALLAVGSGGIFGLGLGNSRQKYSYLPEPTTDSIFAIIAEELGFIGSVVLLAVFATLFVKAIRLTQPIEDNFGRLLGLGIISYLAMQTLINLGSVLGIIPFTGVPLPFISYGGSALIVELTSLGILVNIWKINKCQ